MIPNVIWGSLDSTILLENGENRPDKLTSTVSDRLTRWNLTVREGSTRIGHEIINETIRTIMNSRWKTQLPPRQGAWAFNAPRDQSKFSALRRDYIWHNDQEKRVFGSVLLTFFFFIFSIAHMLITVYKGTTKGVSKQPRALSVDRHYSFQLSHAWSLQSVSMAAKMSMSILAKGISTQIHN